MNEFTYILIILFLTIFILLYGGHNNQDLVEYDSTYFKNLNRIILFEKKLHTNACGDFTMIDKKSFYKMNGYYEFDGFSWHIDSLLLFKAHYYFNLNFINLKFPMYHINHEPGKSYSENKKISINKIKKTKLDFINDEKLLNIINKYKKKKMYKDDKNKAWGLAQKELSVYKI